MSRSRFVLPVMLLVLLGGLVGSATALEATPEGSAVTIVPPGESYGGGTPGEWQARW